MSRKAMVAVTLVKKDKKNIFSDSQNCPTLQHISGQGKVCAQFAIQPGHEITGPNIRAVPDFGFWHRKDGIFGRDSEGSICDESDTATHLQKICQQSKQHNQTAYW
jgi:hypothetical protein